MAALIFVDATTGMRRGETCGLRFCDIDAASEEALITVRAKKFR
jgi:integrase